MNSVVDRLIYKLIKEEILLLSDYVDKNSELDSQFLQTHVEALNASVAELLASERANEGETKKAAKRADLI